MSSTESPTLLEDVRRIMRLKHYSLHTERTYCDWVKQLVKFHRMTERQSLFGTTSSGLAIKQNTKELTVVFSLMIAK